MEGLAGRRFPGCTQSRVARCQAQCREHYLLREWGQALVVASGDWGRLGPCLAVWKPARLGVLTGGGEQMLARPTLGSPREIQ